MAPVDERREKDRRASAVIGVTMPCIGSRPRADERVGGRIRFCYRSLRMTTHSHPRPVSIRWSLFKNLLILVVLISGSLLIYSVAGASRAIRSLSASLFEEVSGTAEHELAKFFAPISKSIEIVRDLGLREAFSPDDPQSG